MWLEFRILIKLNDRGMEEKAILADVFSVFAHVPALDSSFASSLLEFISECSISPVFSLLLSSALATMKIPFGFFHLGCIVIDFS